MLIVAAIIGLVAAIAIPRLMAARGGERPPPSRGQALMSRLALTVAAAALGAAVGQLVAQKTLAPEVFANSRVPAMYGTGGALLAVLGLRLFAMFRMILGELWRERRR